MPKKIYIRTFGCQMNIRDSEAIAGLLLDEGYGIARDEAEADVVLFNTCSVRKHAEDRVWGKVAMLARLNRSPYPVPRTPQIIGIIGCMAQNYKDEIFKRLPHVNFIAGPGDVDKVPGLIKKAASRGEHLKALELKERSETVYSNTYRQDKRRVFVNISEGCNNFCSYCIVPYVRGPQKDRGWKSIVAEIKRLLSQGISDITLLGQNVNSYSGGISFIELLRKIDVLPDLKRLSFVTSHPKDASKELFLVMSGLEKIVKTLHLPVQSGSDRILKLMNRSYTSMQYINLVKEFRTIVKNGRVTTDIIVGFPSETSGDFNDTYQLLKKVKFDAAYIFKYSPRPKTEAAGLRDDVSVEEKKRRHKILLDFQKDVWAKRRNAD